MPHVVARRHATALVQAGSQIPATGMFGHLVQTATLPEPCPAPRRGPADLRLLVGMHTARPLSRAGKKVRPAKGHTSPVSRNLFWLYATKRGSDLESRRWRLPGYAAGPNIKPVHP